MHRIASGLALSCLTLIAVCHASEKPPRPIIEDTYISAPKTLGEYALASSVNYADQGELLAGVALRYRDPLLALMTTDIYVYPGGESETLDHAEQQFRASVQQAAKLGIYRDVRWGTDEPYTLQQRDGSSWQGRMIPMHVRHKDGEASSRTYLFHHGLYNYKLRLDVPASQAAELPAAADALVRVVLPAVQVVSVGSCGRKSVIDVLKSTDSIPFSFVDGVTSDGFGIAIRESELNAAPAASATGNVSSTSLAGLTLLAAQRQIANGCTQFNYDPPTDNMVALKLHYPADFWRSGPAGSK